MKKHIALGIPCGKLDTSDRYYILYRGALYGMPSACYALWKVFGCGNSFDAAKENAKVLIDGYEDLKRLNLIVPLTDAIHHLPLRQGSGQGLSGENDSYVVRCPNADVSLPFLCYFIWCYADGKTSLIDIRKNLRNQGFDISDEGFLNAFYQLLKTEALALV